MNEVDKLDVERNMLLGQILEAVRALKPAPRVFMTAAGPIRVAAAEQSEAKLLEEIERLQAVVADQALTIATLRDTIGKQTADFEKLRGELAACEKVYETHTNALRAELRGFRDREPEVQNLCDWASQAMESVPGLGDPSHEDYALHHHVPMAIRAVRDFKVSGS